MPFKFSRLEIPEVVLVEPSVFGDARGFFLETYKYSDFASAGISESFVQDNYSRSSKGVLRGLHYQLHPFAQGKLVGCVSGSIYDVAVDIRRGSPSFGRWVGAELSSENRRMLYVPPGFAHGFVVLSDSADLSYKCTKEYAGAAERGIIWNDPELAIKWPVSEPLLSERDASLPLLRDAEIGSMHSQEK